MNNAFEKVSWLSNTNVYEVNVRQYTPEGTFMAFSQHIERLHDMGVDVLWFMPITPISIKNRKGILGSYYACSSYIDINAEFGSKSDFKNLVDTAHGFGMKVIIDWVADHTGCDHNWTIDAPSFYKIDEKGNFYDSHGWDDVIDLDYTNPTMRLEMIASMEYWIDQFNIDGFRCDMAMLTPVDFWMQARKKIDAEKPHFWFAELDPMDNLAYMEVFDSAYTWKWMSSTRDFKQSGARDIRELKTILFDYNQMLPVSTFPAWFTSNHDENSWNGTEYEKYAEMALSLAVFSSMWHGLPLIYSGQELPNLKRLLFFDKDEVQWTPHPKLHPFYKLLFAFRKDHKSFKSIGKDSTLKFTTNNVDHHILSFIRGSVPFEVLVIINFSQYDLNDLVVNVCEDPGIYHELFTGREFNFNEKNHRFSLKAWSFEVWYK